MSTNKKKKIRAVNVTVERGDVPSGCLPLRVTCPAAAPSLRSAYTTMRFESKAFDCGFVWRCGRKDCATLSREALGENGRRTASNSTDRSWMGVRLSFCTAVLQRDKDDHFVREMDEEGITGRGVEVDSEDAKLIGGILLHEYSADVQNEFSIKFIEKAKE